MIVVLNFVYKKALPKGGAFSMSIRRVITVATAGENRSCQEHKPKYDGAKPNCATCKRWDPNEERCREEIWVGAWLSEPEDTREIERLMRHDGYTRKNGSIRQIRRGT